MHSQPCTNVIFNGEKTMQTGQDSTINKTIDRTKATLDPTVEPSSIIVPAYNGVDRNAWILGWNPQQELWNGRLAMIGFVAYLMWDWAGYSVLPDVLHLIR
jgi:hypothetical protein